jgi:hypothetical protein
MFIVNYLEGNLNIDLSIKTIMSISKSITRLPTYNSISENDIEMSILISLSQCSDIDRVMEVFRKSD